MTTVQGRWRETLRNRRARRTNSRDWKAEKRTSQENRLEGADQEKRERGSEIHKLDRSWGATATKLDIRMEADSVGNRGREIVSVGFGKSPKMLYRPQTPDPYKRNDPTDTVRNP